MNVVSLLNKRRPPASFPKLNSKKPDDIYLLKDQLGSGAFSVVHLGVHKQSKEQCAVKIVDKKETGPKAMLDEIKVMAELQHENIVNFKEIFDTPKHYYVVMEYITGGELFDRIIELHRYTELDASHVIAQVLHGLKHLHDKGFVHRDLKPENLLLSSKDTDAVVKIADFGFAKQISEGNDESLNNMIGTPPYMAPELVRLRETEFAECGYGRPVDCWAVGVILYILLSGIHPFQIEDEEQMLDNIEDGKWTWLGPNWKSISEEAKDLITKLMEKDPKKRLTIEQTLKHHWFTSQASPESAPHLSAVKDAIKSFQARKKFKGAIFAVNAMNRLKNSLNLLQVNKINETPSNPEPEAQTIPQNPEPEKQNNEPLQQNIVSPKQSNEATKSTRKCYTYEQLKQKPRPEGIDDHTKLESYLSEEEFTTVFKMDKEAFGKMPPWKQLKLRKEKQLF